MNTTGTDSVAGIVNLYKPAGISTARYVYRLRPIFGIRRVGHAGTLDPFADGVVIACVGRATKLVERLMALPKYYRTTIHLGVTNQTYDTEQPFEPVPGVEPVPSDAVQQALSAFVGEIDQVPPAYSAVKIGGTPSYKLAQRGQAKPRKTKKVRIQQLEIMEYAWPRLRLDIHCGRGTYIRAIARDLGRLLKCGACCETLTRRAVGSFRIEQSVNLQTAPRPGVRDALLPLSEARRLLENPPSEGKPDKIR